jgi:hypothetical protein
MAGVNRICHIPRDDSPRARVHRMHPFHGLMPLMGGRHLNRGLHPSLN